MGFNLHYQNNEGNEDNEHLMKGREDRLARVYTGIKTSLNERRYLSTQSTWRNVGGKEISI